MHAKITKIFETTILSQLDIWENALLCGDLSNVESSLHTNLQVLYGEFMQVLLTKVGSSDALKACLLSYGDRLGIQDLKLRETRLQIGTGQWIDYKSFYGHTVMESYEGANRQLSHSYWGCVDRATPRYVSQVCMLSVTCPSFDIAKQVLSSQGIAANYKRIRRLSILSGAASTQLGISAQLDEMEDLKDMRVVVQLDGGRSRVREQKDKVSSKGYTKYDTPWREPKLIAIHVIDEQGQIAKSVRKPLYQAAIQDAKACFDDLVNTLKLLKVHEAKEIQFLADGAEFIWKRVRKAFKKAGVAPKKVTYTLDYYHAVEHLKALSELLPWTKTERETQFKEWKSWLWEGLAKSIVRQFKKHIRAANLVLSPAMETALNYFTKHHDRMQYKKFKKRKLLCGSGLVESAIRRVINLRFKGPSTFWRVENLDKMYTLRCAMLSGRWHNLFSNIELRIKSNGTI